MAACETCGEKAGFGKKLCESCTAKANEQKRKEAAAASARKAEEDRVRREAEEERKRQAELARQQRYQAYVKGRLDEMHSLVDQGVNPFLYDVIVISAQSRFNEKNIGAAPNLDELRSYGWAGWDIVGIIPSTYGEALTNTSYGASSGTTWGAGVGGLVIGAYVLLKFEITRGVLEQRRDYIVSLVAKDFPG